MDKVGNTECMSVSQQHPAALLQILQDIAVFGAKKGQFLFWKKASIYKFFKLVDGQGCNFLGLKKYHNLAHDFQNGQFVIFGSIWGHNI